MAGYDGARDRYRTTDTSTHETGAACLPGAHAWLATLKMQKSFETS